jgi:hypothetical protein
LIPYSSEKRISASKFHPVNRADYLSSFKIVPGCRIDLQHCVEVGMRAEQSKV